MVDPNIGGNRLELVPCQPSPYMASYGFSEDVDGEYGLAIMLNGVLNQPSHQLLDGNATPPVRSIASQSIGCVNEMFTNNHRRFSSTVSH